MYLSIPHKDDTLEFGKSPLVFMGGNELNRGTTREGIEKALETEYRVHGKACPTGTKGRHYVAEQFDPDYDVLWKEEQARENGPFWPSNCWTKPQIPKWLLSAKKAQYADNPDEFLAWKFSLKTRDWKKLGKKAGLDAWEIKVLEYRSQGISRDRAMELQLNEISRKAIQAAWKRFDRTGLKELQDSLDKISPWDVSEEPPRNTRNTGAITMTANGRRTMQAVWKRTGGRSREDLGRFLSNYRAAIQGRGPTQFASLVKIIDSKCPE